MIAPPSERFCDDSVMKLLAWALAMNLIWLMLPFSRLAPSKVALVTTWVICRRIDLKSESSAVRDAVSMDGSIAAVTFSFICTRRSEMVWPAVEATSAIDVARSRLIFTDPSDPISARCPCAIAQTAALSFALAIARPVLILF